MKYDFKYLTKLIALLLIAALSLALFSCGNTDEESSVPEEVSSAPALSVEEAVALIERDRLVTEIFVCNSLCDLSQTEAVRSFVSNESEYALFSAIESLIDSTYSKESGDKGFFLSYPNNNEPSVVGVEGKTSVFRHSGSNYTDFADTSTISVSDTDDENIKVISAKTATGKEITLNARCHNGVWLLEKGIYRTNPPENAEFYGRFNNSSVGSFSTLSGDILVIELFISDEETDITSAEETVFHQKVANAADRFVLHASNHGVQVNFEYKSAYFEHDGVLGTRVLDFDVMFAETGFGTLQAFAEANYDVSAYDGYFFAVCVDKALEISVGVYDNTEDTEIYYGERVLMGRNATDFEIYKSMLAMLGAYSYDQGLLDKYTESLFRFYFPSDCTLVTDMSVSVMSPVTAYNCGLTDKLDSLYRIFIPNN